MDLWLQAVDAAGALPRSTPLFSIQEKLFEAGIKDLGGFDHLDPALASKAKGQVCMCVYVCVRVCFMCTQALFVCMNHTYTTLSLSLSLSLSHTHTHTQERITDAQQRQERIIQQFVEIGLPGNAGVHKVLETKIKLKLN